MYLSVFISLHPVTGILFSMLTAVLDCRFQLNTPSLVRDYRYLPLSIGIMVGGMPFPAPLILGKAMFLLWLMEFS